MNVAPLPEAGERQVLAATVRAQCAARQSLPALLEVVPQFDEAVEVGLGVDERSVALVGCRRSCDWALAWIRHAEGRGNDEHRFQAALVAAPEQHSADSRIEGKSRE